jgi:hypothetical protein
MLMENDLEALLLAMAVSTVMVLLTVLVHYECLNLLSRYVRSRVPFSRIHVLAVIIGVFTAHTIEVWLYAGAFYLLDRWSGGMGIAGHLDGSLLDYLYFSTVSYTSLGLGDLYPLGALRLVTGIEALNGLILIGWSASFTYLVMQKRWRL